MVDDKAAMPEARHASMALPTDRLHQQDYGGLARPAGWGKNRGRPSQVRQAVLYLYCYYCCTEIPNCFVDFLLLVSLIFCLAGEGDGDYFGVILVVSSYYPR